MEEDECISSYDVTALFTAVPFASAIQIIKNWLEQDTELPSRTIMSANDITKLLGFCLNNTCFLFQGQFLNKPKELSWGHPLALLWLIYIWKEEFEHRAIKTAVDPPRIWKKYVGDTFLIQHQLHKE